MDNISVLVGDHVDEEDEVVGWSKTFSCLKPFSLNGVRSSFFLLPLCVCNVLCSGFSVLALVFWL